MKSGRTSNIFYVYLFKTVTRLLLWIGKIFAYRPLDHGVTTYSSLPLFSSVQRSFQYRRYGEARGAVSPLTAACASPFWFTQNTVFLEHHVTTKQQTMMEKGNSCV